MVISFQEIKERRQKLIELIQKHHKQEGIIFLCAGFEHEHERFRQESSFYYFTGITEPGVAVVIEPNGTTTLFIPNHGSNRSVWMPHSFEVGIEQAAEYGVDRIEYLGELIAGYQLYPFFQAQDYQHVVKLLERYVAQDNKIFTLNPTTPYGYVEQRHTIARICSFVPVLKQSIIDISAQVAQLRRKKSKKEIELLFKAIEITVLAQEAAAAVIAPGVMEHEIQAALEYIFIEAGAQRAAFPSIVGSGKNSTILHYNENDRRMESKDLVVIDVGAEFDYHCADLTRTYPVSGTFTTEQRKIYNIVLDTQEYIADLVKPGYWISNKDNPEQSLNHLAKAYLKEQGYDSYFPHGIGHFLGLDVHDVGDYAHPLEEGEVITIEPGIYIPEQQIGIRIEDNYWIVKDAAVCLSENLLRHPDDVEKMVKDKLGKNKKAPKARGTFDA